MDFDMTRTEMLSQLHKLRYCVLWPGRWDDIGFTERPIWVCAEGYGYYADDEPCYFVELNDFTDEFIKEIKERIANDELTSDSLKGTPLDCSSLEWRIYDDESLSAFLSEYEKSSVHGSGHLFIGEDYNGWEFFKTEEEMIQAFEKDYCSKLWDDMSDKELSIWITRLFEEAPILELPINLRMTRNDSKQK